MRKLHNEITIDTSVERIWQILSDPSLLEKYDPTVKKSTLVSTEKTGIGAKRKVDMLDGKNWFEEIIKEYEPNQLLSYQLTDCTFPIHHLKHTYTFEKKGNQTIVKQVMEYKVKFGFIGKILDTLMIKKQTDSGIKKFFSGLKKFAEK